MSLLVNQKLDIKEQIYIVKKSLPRERFLIKFFNPNNTFTSVLKDVGTIFEITTDNMYVVTKILSKGEFVIRHIKNSELKDLRAKWAREALQKKKEKEFSEKKEIMDLEALKRKLAKEEASIDEFGEKIEGLSYKEGDAYAPPEVTLPYTRIPIEGEEDIPIKKFGENTLIEVVDTEDFPNRGETTGPYVADPLPGELS